MNVDLTITPAALWTILGLALVLAEFAFPAVILVFFGAAALVVALLLWMGIDLPLNFQILTFAGLAVGLIVGARRHVREWFYGRSEHASDGIEVLVPGTPVVAQQDFIDGVGVVSYRGARWNAETEEPVMNGQRLWITGRRGLVLQVTTRPPGKAR